MKTTAIEQYDGGWWIDRVKCGAATTFELYRLDEQGYVHDRVECSYLRDAHELISKILGIPWPNAIKRRAANLGDLRPVRRA